MIGDMDEKTFQTHAEEAMARLTRALYGVEEASGFDVEDAAGRCI